MYLVVLGAAVGGCGHLESPRGLLDCFFGVPGRPWGVLGGSWRVPGWSLGGLQAILGPRSRSFPKAHSHYTKIPPKLNILKLNRLQLNLQELIAQELNVLELNTLELDFAHAKAEICKN